MSIDMYPDGAISYLLENHMNETCTVCGNKITTMAFKGELWCSADCKKKIVDVSSVGTYMFVTKKEAVVINKSREPGMILAKVGGISF